MPSSHGPASASPALRISAAAIRLPAMIGLFIPQPSSRGSFLRIALRRATGELGLDAQAKFASNFLARGGDAPGEAEMTYCCGILVRDGLVMIADTRTNAGLDNVSTFRKLHIFSKPGERIMAIASAGNLAISQSVLSTLTEGVENTETGEIETLMNAPTMFQAAQRIGRVIRRLHDAEGAAL